MGKFVGNFQYIKIKRSRHLVTRGFRFYDRCDGIGEYIEVPPGVDTNFSTLPTWLRVFLFIITFGYFRYDAKDFRRASAAHDGLVEEHEWKINIMCNGHSVRTPDWSESAWWYIHMLHTAQLETRPHFPYFDPTLESMVSFPFRYVNWYRKVFSDFLIRWTCFLGVIAWGVLNNER